MISVPDAVLLTDVLPTPHTAPPHAPTKAVFTVMVTSQFSHVISISKTPNICGQKCPNLAVYGHFPICLEGCGSLACHWVTTMNHTTLTFFRLSGFGVMRLVATARTGCQGGVPFRGALICPCEPWQTSADPRNLGAEKIPSTMKHLDTP